MSSIMPSLRLVDRQLVAALRQHGELSRDQLARLSGLPRSTVTDALTRLLRHGVVTERPMPNAAGRIGRPPRLLALAAPTGLVGVIALTHQTLQAGVLDFDGTLYTRQINEAYLPDQQQSGMIESGLALLHDALPGTSRPLGDLTCAVIGIPTPVSDTRGRPLPNSLAPPWIPADPAAELGRHLDVPIWLENDANLGALGEAAFGAAADMTSFIYIKIAHGIGAGLVLDRRLYRGTHGLAGELAHIHVEGNGSLCRCGGRGCLMTAFNTPQLIDWIRTVHPDVGSMAEVLSLAADRDTGAWRLLRDLGRTIGRSLADFCVYLAPDGVVLEGILENAGAPLIDGIREMLDEFTPPAIASRVRLVGGLLGDRAELLGAAVLARRHALRELDLSDPV
jgi:predicted NBD/HSP70 family sugar kinase